ncbi:hypothetical protein BTS2_3310 [Bacillus sp. TS-2]|nr:hypothetical protein BTS2_3310 [Bacillus sp. TS-2]
MSHIKYVGEFEFEKGNVRVLWELGEQEQRGYEIEIDYDCSNGDLKGLGNWSFGYENWSYEVWEAWGEYLENCLSEIEGNEEELKTFLKRMDNIDCTYTLYNQELALDFQHLKDLEKIKSLINKERAE